jgi:hypothetical protein
VKPLPTLTQIAKGTALFGWYSDGVLHYDLYWTDRADGDPLSSDLVFPVDIPVSDAGGGHFTAVMKGMNILRWARGELQRIETEERLNEKLKSEWAEKLALNGGAEG